MSDQQTVQDHIRKTVNNDDVVLFMKGTMKFPQCGFSAQVRSNPGSIGRQHQRNQRPGRYVDP